MIQKKTPFFFHKCLVFHPISSHSYFNLPNIYKCNKLCSYAFSTLKTKNVYKTDELQIDDSPFFQTFEKKNKFGLIEIFSMFKNINFLQFMNENYQMLPFLFSNSYLKEVKSYFFQKIRK